MKASIHSITYETGRFRRLDARGTPPTLLRRYETAQDLTALPCVFLIARLDGRGFTRLTKELYKFETPFDAVFGDHMIATTKHIMGAGFRVLYGHTQSDEISLPFNHDDELFDRRFRKLHFILAAAASASFSSALGGVATFHCRSRNCRPKNSAR